MGKINTKIPEGSNEARINIQILCFVKGHILPRFSLLLLKQKIIIPIAIGQGNQPEAGRPTWLFHQICYRNKTSKGNGDFFSLQGCVFLRKQSNGNLVFPS
jgi:hypothetical protein